MMELEIFSSNPQLKPKFSYSQRFGNLPHFKAGGIRLYLTERGCRSPFSSML